MKFSLPRRNVWLDWFKNVACALTVTGTAGASAVIAASESLQPMPGDAFVVLCGAVGRCLAAGNSQTTFGEGAVVQFLTRPAP